MTNQPSDRKFPECCQSGYCWHRVLQAQQHAEAHSTKIYSCFQLISTAGDVHDYQDHTRLALICNCGQPTNDANAATIPSLPVGEYNCHQKIVLQVWCIFLNPKNEQNRCLNNNKCSCLGKI